MSFSRINNYPSPLYCMLTIAIVGLSILSLQGQEELNFKSEPLGDGFETLWAYYPADITGDGIADLVHITNNAHGGQLAYFKGSRRIGAWEQIVIAPTAPGGSTFALGDMECADMDMDGDIDILAGAHPGEWNDGNAETQLYWYENPTWVAHPIGTAPDFVKDVSIADFNNDGKMDVAALTFESHSLRIFTQQSADEWELMEEYMGFGNMHEGMDCGDLNGDGYKDIFANGHIFYNPKGDANADWTTYNLDPKWNNQQGDWSRNGTKTYLQDVNGDGVAEIFVAHSERRGYPLSMYMLNNSGAWQEQIVVDSMPACHTLQVYDFDLDGNFDILAGVNMGRAATLGIDSYEVVIYKGNSDLSKWTPHVIDKQGIYNGIACDFDNDGDLDIFRLNTHESTDMQIMKGKVAPE